MEPVINYWEGGGRYKREGGSGGGGVKFYPYKKGGAGNKLNPC